MITLTFDALPSVSGGSHITTADFQKAASQLSCDVASIKAVVEVEAGDSGFLPSGKPKILFEAHHFSKLTSRIYDDDYPDISSHNWDKTLYIGGEAEYSRLKKAMTLNRQAALKSASWGRFQIMGFNFKSAGFGNIEDFVEAMFISEGNHLSAFVSFLENENLGGALRENRWTDFASGYNGAVYRKNSYDKKLRDAYQKYRSTS